MARVRGVGSCSLARKDGDEVGEALARPRARGQYVVVAAGRRADGLGLMAVKRDGRTGAVLVFAHPEDPLALRMQDPLAHEVGDPSPALEGRVELHQRRGP